MHDDSVRVRGWRFLFCAMASLIVGAGHAQAPVPEDGPSQKFVAEYAKAWNAGDVEALNTMWAADGELVDSQGVVVDRKALLANRLAKSEGTRPVLSIALDKVRLVEPNVALVDGESKLAGPDGSELQRTRFAGVLIKQDGAWRIRLIRQLSTRPSPQSPPTEPLKDFAWQMGEWAGMGDGLRVHASTQWDMGNRYIVTRYEYEPAAGEPYDAEVRAGWDPESRSIKTWYFDSRGGLSTTTWGKNGDHWLGAVAGTLSNGTPFTATLAITQIDNDSYLRTLSNMKVNGQAVPDQELHMFRLPAEAPQ
jgi:uncharacterized protein (TIGR02246 family)